MKTLKDRVHEVAKPDIYMDVDGYYHYLPTCNTGHFDAHVLRIIADLLDDMNKEWNEMLDREFSETKESTQTTTPPEGV
jgi:hypothetical protein